MPDYTKLSITELEAEQSALECALQSKRAQQTLADIDGLAESDGEG